MSSHDGGPAFPIANPDYQTFQQKTVDDTRRLMSGMSLLDYFAAKALQGFIANKARPTTFNPDDDAKYCYMLATAMLAAKRNAEQEVTS